MLVITLFGRRLFNKCKVINYSLNDRYDLRKNLSNFFYKRYYLDEYTNTNKKMIIKLKIIKKNLN
jgi:hypothetical protein